MQTHGTKDHANGKTGYKLETTDSCNPQFAKARLERKYCFCKNITLYMKHYCYVCDVQYIHRYSDCTCKLVLMAEKRRDELEDLEGAELFGLQYKIIYYGTQHKDISLFDDV